MQLPWRDRRGKFLPLKAAVLVAAFLPGLWCAGNWIAGNLGGRPVTEAIHSTGDWSIRFFLISLAISPFGRVLNWTALLQVRRMVGLTALAYAVVHFVLYIVDQKFALGTVASEIVNRIYLTIGFVALLAFAVLGATSTDNALKRLGRRWKHIHRLTYPATALGLLHFFMQTKLNVSEPTFVAGLYAWEMLWRSVPTDWQRRVATFPILAVAAGIATMVIEFAWYGLATKVDPFRVLNANASVSFGLRPAHWVVVWAIVATFVVVARSFQQRRLATLRAA